MKEIIYKFLDEYLGDEVVCIKTRPKSGSHNVYDLCSKKNKTIIIVFTISDLDGQILIFKSSQLTNLVSDLFSMDDFNAADIIRNWFGDKHNLNKVKDLIKFISYTAPSKLTSFG